MFRLLPTPVVVLWNKLRSAYWFIPSLMACVAVGLAFGSIRLDEYVRGAVESKLGWVYAGGPEGARAVLATIAGSIVTVAGTTFSITIAAFSLASSQFGPRLLRTFRRDTGNQVVLGTFIATFLYCLLVLRSVRGTESNTYVPHLSVTLGVVLACLSLAVLIFFIHHTAVSIQVSTLIESVGRELDEAVTENLPETREDGGAGAATSEDAESGHLILAGESGYLLNIDHAKLVEIAAREECVFRLLHHAGAYLIAGTPVVAVSGAAGGQAEWKTVEAGIYLGTERDPEQDLEFGFLQLAEIAVRALSPGVNDPFTAVSCVDRISSAFCLAVRRSRPPGSYTDAQGELRVIAVPVTWRELATAAFAHIRHAAKGNAWVLTHLSGKIAVILTMTIDDGCRAVLSEERALAISAKDNLPDG